MSKKKKTPKTYVEIYQSMRKDWNGINPVTKVIPDKRRKPDKYKKQSLYNND